MSLQTTTLLALLAIAPNACTRSATNAEGKGQPAPTSSAASKTQPTAPASSSEPLDVPASWPPAVAAAYRELSGLRADDRGRSLKAVLALARQGGAAEEALLRLAKDPKITERVRALAGVMVVRLHSFDRAGLQRLLGIDNAFAAREAALLLSELGGHGAKAALEEAANKRPELASYLRHRAAQLPKEPLAAPIASLLHQLLADPRAEKKRWAATALAVDHPRESERPLRRLSTLVVADKETRMQAAFALVLANKNNLERLESFARPGNERFLRYAAFDELMRLGAPGQAVVKRYAETPGEKLRGYLRRLLEKKPKRAK